ncbi:MAG: hypothetical protein RJA36_1354 [Pseudomonadota bacterium]|jgi:hypothetical protein
MPDQRTPLEKKLADLIGPPLYYCSDCLRAVQVTPIEGREPDVVRPCGQQCGHQIIAPRKAVAVGEGGMNLPTRLKVGTQQLLASLTGRCV